MLLNLSGICSRHRKWSNILPWKWRAIYNCSFASPKQHFDMFKGKRWGTVCATDA